MISDDTRKLTSELGYLTIAIGALVFVECKSCDALEGIERELHLMRTAPSTSTGPVIAPAPK